MISVRSCIVGAATVVVSIAVAFSGSCGGQTDPTLVRQLDGAVVRLPAGEFCKTWDAAAYIAAAVDSPPCDPNLVVRGLPKGVESPPCLDWARRMGLPIVPHTHCAGAGARGGPPPDAGPEAGACAMDQFISEDEPSVLCHSKTMEGDQYCVALFGQLVRGEGTSAGGCGGFTDQTASDSWPLGVAFCDSNDNHSSSTDYEVCNECPTFNTYVTPPVPQVCVKRSTGWRCEQWCQAP